jgi:hypothetical protein
MTAMLFLMQPVARLAGRLRNGLSPWRRRLRPEAAWPRPRSVEVWSESWRDPQACIQALQDSLAASGGYVRSGGPFDRWDLDLRAGPLGGVRIRTAVEEHGSGRQLLRAKIWPRAWSGGLTVAALLAALSAYALHLGHLEVGTTMGIATLLLAALVIEGTGTAMNLALREISNLEPRDRESDPGLGFESGDGPGQAAG